MGHARRSARLLCALHNKHIEFWEIRKIKSPTGEEDPSGFEPDQQLGGGELLIHIERHWEEEIAVSMIVLYQILPVDKWLIAQCSNAYCA
ncbi:hypothetical protein [Rhizobium sp. SYY.PMSO]|uniref:hypothetical protein n=1 Tax=Rhizobium sp. SYY.PMSO TaxID=3382192 RepID=UPI0013B03080